MRHLSIFTFILISACTREESIPLGVRYGDINAPCPAFDSVSILNWFPYHLNDKFVFKDSIGNEMSFTIDNSKYSAEGETTVPCYSVYGSIVAIKDTNNINDMAMVVSSGSSPATHRASLSLQGRDVFMHYMSIDTLSIDKRHKSKHYDTITLDGKLYYDVYEATPAIIGTAPLIYTSIYISRGYGVVGFVKDSTAFWLQ